MTLISKKEWLWVLLMALVVMLITLVPYIYGIIIKPDNLHFSGVHRLNSGDTYSYLAWMEQAREGNWLFKILYTSESQPRVIFLPFFLVMGVLARLTNLSNIVFFHLTRVILGFIFLLVAYRFLALFFNNSRHRKIAWLILIFSSGLGWLLGSYFTTTDLFMTEAITFLNLYESPLNTVSLILMICLFYYLLQFYQEGHRRYIIYAGLALLFLSIIHPFDAITVIVVLFFLSIFIYLGDCHFWPKLKATLLVWLISLPGFIITALAFIKNPALHSWQEANVRLSPHVGAYCLGYGVLLILALFSWKRFSIKEEKYALIIAWLIATIFLIFQPLLHFQRKFALGLHIPVVILAACGLFFIDKKYQMSRRFIIALIAILSLSNLKIMLNDTYAFDTLSAPYYWPKDYISAIDFLKEQPKGVVLTNPSFSNIIPGLTGQTVYLGHGDQTADNPRKIETLNWFLEDNHELTAKKDWLNESGIKYIIYISDLMPSHFLISNQKQLGLEIIYQNDSTTVLIYNL